MTKPDLPRFIIARVANWDNGFDWQVLDTHDNFAVVSAHSHVLDAGTDLVVAQRLHDKGKIT